MNVDSEVSSLSPLLSSPQCTKCPPLERAWVLYGVICIAMKMHNRSKGTADILAHLTVTHFKIQNIVDQIMKNTK